MKVYNWSEFIDPGVIADFQRESGIKVNYDVYDSNEIMEAKLLAGHTGYDIAVPGGAFFAKEVKAGVYRKLDPDRLPHLKNLDPEAAAATAVYDPGNQYGVDYMWLVSTGMGYDAAAIRRRMPDAPVDSWRLILDPTVVARFKGCGVSVLDSPEDVVAAVLSLLGKDPNSESPADLQAVNAVLMGIRPSLRHIDSSRYVQDLANGDLCLAIGWSGDVVQSRRRAREAGKDADIVYVIPREGSVTVADVLAIPTDAPHAANALEFIDYLLRPEVAERANMSHAIRGPALDRGSLDLGGYASLRWRTVGSRIPCTHPVPGITEIQIRRMMVMSKQPTATLPADTNTRTDHGAPTAVVTDDSVDTENPNDAIEAYHERLREQIHKTEGG